MKSLRILFAIVAIVISLPAAMAAGGDIARVKGAIYKDMLRGAPSEGEVASMLSSITAEGGFEGIDYADEEFNTGDKKRVHLQKTGRLARAYSAKGGKYYQSEELYTAIERLLTFWIESDLDDGNWWQRCIGFPKDMIPAAVLMGDVIKERNAELHSAMVEYLSYSWDGNTPPFSRVGANGTDVGKVTFVRALLAEDETLLREVIDFVGSLIFIAKGGIEEGIYPDYSFSQHSKNGRQLYLGTYGREYLDGALFFMEYTNSTKFALAQEKVAMIEDLVLYGVAWMWYRGELDPNQCGRKNYDKINFAPSFIPITERLIALDTPQKEALQGVLMMMRGKSELTGNRAYPYHDYMIHRGKGYMATVRMTSTRTVGNEAGNGQGFENYHTGDGATYFTTKGGEYTSIFGKWNWRFIPGTTVVADSAPMPKPMWGKGGVGGNDYAGVASTGDTGVAGFIFDKDNLVAHKAWFNFEGVVVALGAGISTARADGDVVTTINQTALRGKVERGASRVWHADIGYLNLGDVEIEVVEDKTKSIVTLSLNHGEGPQGASYAYVVYPNIDAKLFAKRKPKFEILCNSDNVQAVKDLATGEVQAVFYKEGEVSIDKKNILSLSKPAVVVCRPMEDGGYRVVVGDPLCERGEMSDMEVKIYQGDRLFNVNCEYFEK